MTLARAAVLWETGRPFEIIEVEVAPPQRGEVSVRMAASGLCQTDLHVRDGRLPSAVPVIPGHEGAGVVVEVGEGVASVEVGDHVVALWRPSCGRCEECALGRPVLCEVAWQIRASGQLLDGTTRFRARGCDLFHWAGVSTFASVSTMPETAVLKIRRDFPLEKAALLGCGVITGVGAVANAAQVRAGSSVAVFGAGGIGVNVVQGARLLGAHPIIAVDRVADKLAAAERLGATAVVDASVPGADPVEAIRALTGGRGVEYAFEAVGLAATMQQAYASLRPGGTCVVVGVAAPDVVLPIPAAALVLGEKTVRGSIYGSSRPRVDLPRLIELARAGRLELDALCTRTYRLDELNDACAALERGELIRGVVVFDASDAP